MRKFRAVQIYFPRFIFQSCPDLFSELSRFIFPDLFSPDLFSRFIFRDLFSDLFSRHAWATAEKAAPNTAPNFAAAQIPALAANDVLGNPGLLVRIKTARYMWTVS